MILIEDHTDEDLDALAKEHYRLLNPKKKNGDFTEASLIEKIKSAAINDAADIDRSKFWEFLSDNNFLNLEKVITARPQDLEIIIDEINDLVGDNFISISRGYNLADLTNFGKIVKEVFDYSLRYRSQEFSKEHFGKLKLGFCPYCNETSVSVVVIKDPMTVHEKSQALLQVDHFFPQVRYPYLALSFFNLIPSCPYCNASLKGEKDFKLGTHFNPFHKRLDDHFAFYITSEVIKTKDDIIIERKDLTAHPANACQDFALIARYNTDAVKQEIFSGYKLIQNRPNKVIQKLSSKFAAVLPNFSYEDVLTAFNVPRVRSQIASRRLGKLKRDICKDLGVIP